MADTPPPAESSTTTPERTAEIRAFLIADVRGYTLFTQERGDEAAGKLTAKFAGVAREGVEAFGGEVIELRGDEALAVFASPRQAVRAAVELQGRFAEETEADPSLPLLVGIGLDAGEAVPMEGGWRGGALNLAARLCGQAGPGEVLASRELAHLAGKIDNVRYTDRGALHVKGMADPVHAIRVIPEGQDPAARLARFRPPPPSRRRLGFRDRRVAIVVAVAVVAVAVAAGAVAAALVRGGSKEIVLGSNTVARIDPSTNRFTSVVGVGELPTGVAIGEGAVWVITQDRTLYRIDPESGQAIKTIGLPGIPTGIAVGEGAIWVAMGFEAAGPSLLQINPKTYGEVPISVPGSALENVTVAEGALWAISGIDNYLSKINPVTNRVVGRVCLGDQVGSLCMGQQPVALAYGQGALWVANALDRTVWRIDPNRPARPKEQIPKIGLTDVPTSLAVGSGRVWVISNVGNSLAVINARTNQLVTTISLGKGPTGVAAEDAGVWVAEGWGQEVVRVDPIRARLRANIPVRAGPDQVAVGLGAVWVTIHAP
jgi:virginiamycin B lyase